MEWDQPSESIITGYQIKLLSPNSDYEQVFNLSSEFHSKILESKSNTVYEVNIRAKNSEGYSLWAKQQLTTTAGTVKTFSLMIFFLWSLLLSLSVLLLMYSLLLVLMIVAVFYQSISKLVLLWPKVTERSPNCKKWRKT